MTTNLDMFDRVATRRPGSAIFKNNSDVRRERGRGKGEGVEGALAESLNLYDRSLSFSVALIGRLIQEK